MRLTGMMEIPVAEFSQLTLLLSIESLTMMRFMLDKKYFSLKV